MDRAIDLITKYITTCVDCELAKSKVCEFLLIDGKVPSQDNNPYMEDGIMELGAESRAFRIRRKMGYPCDEQMDFEKFLRKLEGLLEKVTIAYTTADLLRQLAKINRIYSIIQRSPEIISCALGDITLASMEKCFARIDYHYLESGADILSAIQSVLPDYDRMGTLLYLYPESIIKSYIRNATVLELDQLTSGDILMSALLNNTIEQSRIQEESELIDNDATSDSDEAFSIDYVNSSGVEEIDRIFRLIIEDNPIYSDEVFRADIKTFRKKCNAMANSDEPLEKKEAWIVAIINVIAESYYHLTWDGSNVIGDRLFSFWAVIEAAFLKSPQQICIKNLALELSIDDIITRIAPETIKRRKEVEDEHGHKTNPLSISELQLFTELGPTIGYNERRICNNCSKQDCPFRWGIKKMYVEELENEEEDESEETGAAIVIPEVFNDNGIQYLDRLGNYCNENYEWKDKSQKTLMCQVAHVIGGLINIPSDRKWKPFEDLWRVKGLSAAYYKRNSRPLDKEIRDLFPEYKGL